VTPRGPFLSVGSHSASGANRGSSPAAQSENLPPIRNPEGRCRRLELGTLAAGHRGGFRVKEEGRRGGRGLVQLARLLINEDRHQSAAPQVRCPKGNGGSDGIEGTWVSRRPEFGVRPRLGADGSGSIAHRARHHHGREGPAVAVPTALYITRKHARMWLRMIGVPKTEEHLVPVEERTKERGGQRREPRRELLACRAAPRAQKRGAASMPGRTHDSHRETKRTPRTKPTPPVGFLMRTR